MHGLTDQQLLADYTARRSEPAFAELVHRHVDFVYSAAVRMVRDAHLAEDVTQTVFMALAQNAQSLTDRTVLSGWLHRTAQNLAANAVRADVRRRVREQEVATMNELTVPDATWENIAPQLDTALAELGEADRDAILLRYFEKKSAAEMAGILGVSDDAAQKRVSRAVEHLREFFAKRGVTAGAGGLAAIISANAVQAAPGGLAAAIAAAGLLTGTAVSSSTSIAATKSIVMTTLQKAIIVAVLTAAAGSGIFEARQASQLRDQVQMLQQQQAPLVRQIQQLQNNFADTTNRSAGLLAENSRLNSNPNQAELLKLRGEVAALRNAASDPDRKAFKELANRVKSLRQIVEQRPDKQIPELQFLTDKVWADVAWNADLDTEDGIRVALSQLRGEAENIFLNEMLHNALKKYLAANNDILPASLLDLKPFFTVPVTDAMLSRYELLQSGKPDPQADLVKLSSYTDEDYDSFHTITLNGASGGGFNRNQDAINDAAREFARLNNYQSPTNPVQIVPFLSRAIDPVTTQKYLDQFVMDQPSPDEIIMSSVLHAYFVAHAGARPTKGADLLPYITTPEQQVAFQRLEGGSK